MTILQAATRLGISPAAVRALVQAGKLPHHRPTPRRVVLDGEDVEQYWAGCRRQGATPSRPLNRVSLECTRPFARRVQA